MPTYQNYNETIKQWSGVFGYDSSAPVEVDAGTPSAEYTKYGKFIAYWARLSGGRE